MSCHCTSEMKTVVMFTWAWENMSKSLCLGNEATHRFI